ncbi:MULTISPECIES: hypothetical protein [Chryseobacterium]|uniref:hypothetical protein n=1 Tax=Chryseobacterium TaxID=59732 RepID=UPI000C9DE4B5|nr:MULTISPECIES: hypothetical protein [Chryseobacterium]VXC56257.1 conserved hypothetical protein [Chryseobacterium sp. 8AT]
MSSLKKFLQTRNAFPYAIQFIDDKWYLVDRRYQKISEGYEISEKKLNEITNIANKLKGSAIDNKNGKTKSIWFYNGGLRKALEQKDYLNEFSESINSIKVLLDKKEK